MVNDFAHNEAVLEAPLGTVASVNEVTDLIPEVTEGNEAAERQFFEKVVPFVGRMTNKLNSDEPSRDEVAHRSTVSIIGGIEGFNGDAKLSTWITRVVKSKTASVHNLKRSVDEPSLGAADNFFEQDQKYVGMRQQETPEESAENSELKSRLVAILSSLPERDQALIVLKNIYDLPHEEIAKRLGITLSATKTAYHRALLKLQGLGRADQTLQLYAGKKDEELSENTLEQ